MVFDLFKRVKGISEEKQESTELEDRVSRLSEEDRREIARFLSNMFERNRARFINDYHKEKHLLDRKSRISYHLPIKICYSN